MKYMWPFVVAFAVVAACKGDPGQKDIDPAAWVKEHKAEVDAVRAKFDAVAGLIKDLPATSTHVADPATPPFVLFQMPSVDNQNALMVSTVNLRGFPESGSDEGKSPQKGELSISPNYTGYFDMAPVFDLVDKGTVPSEKREGVMNYQLKQMKDIRYLIVTRTVSYKPGSVDAAKRSFVGGTWSGVAHLVDLDGPKHLGSIAFAAESSGKFESYKGSEQFMLYADLKDQVVKAFRAEWTKVFPKLVLPPTT